MNAERDPDKKRTTADDVKRVVSAYCLDEFGEEWASASVLVNFREGRGSELLIVINRESNRSR